MKHLQYSIGYITDPGNHRGNNEDSLLVKAGSQGERMFALLAVADGMGGLSKGELASAAAVAALEQWWAEALPGLLQPGPDWAGIAESLAVLPETIHWRIKALGGGPSGSTLSMAFVYDDRVLTLHVGDSRIYRVRDGACTQLTRDQTWCQDEVDAGRLTPDAARAHPMGHVLTSTLGAGARFQLERTEHTLADGDLLLLCSDGFFGELDLPFLCRDWRRKEPVQDILETAKAAVKAGEARDNLTAILLRAERKRGFGG